ncbi:MAG: sialate O-acetylesterase [Draconibacterium sp.]
MRKILILLLILHPTFFISVNAAIKLPAIFGDFMILQQKTETAIWGKATPNKNVEIIPSWDNKLYSGMADNNGAWKIKISTPEAGGPYTITISDGSPIILQEVLIGEVWVCSGQSNMQMSMLGFINQPVTGANEAIATSSNESIRLFTVQQEKSLYPEDDFKGTWKKCIPEHVVEFSATAYFYGKMLHQILGVPVGLICSSWGGTRIEPWIGEDGFKNFDWIKLPDKTRKDDYSTDTPSVLFNAMISPMVGFSIAGCIWYQGESNIKEPERYGKLLQSLVENWRNKWGTGDFPFYYVQIAPFDYDKSGINSAFLREVQFKMQDEIPNVGMACILDSGEKDCIHPSNKKLVGDRLAYLALNKTYGKIGIEYSGPVLKDMFIDGPVVKLTFDHAPKGLTSYGKELVNFKISGDNKRFFPAKATITREGVTLFCPQVEKPLAVRYAFDNFVEGELFNTLGLPASSFRTDNWDIK